MERKSMWWWLNQGLIWVWMFKGGALINMQLAHQKMRNHSRDANLRETRGKNQEHVDMSR